MCYMTKAVNGYYKQVCDVDTAVIQLPSVYKIVCVILVFI